MAKKLTDKEQEDVLLYGHILPIPDPAYCSDCRKPIIHGSGPGAHNVVRINKAKEKILSTSGEALGTKGEARPRAFFHTECFQKIIAKQRIPGRIECKHCGILSMAKTLQDGRSIKEVCLCSCHSGADYCSLLVS